MKRDSRRSWRLAAVLTVAVIGVGTWGVMQVFASAGSAKAAAQGFSSAGKLSPFAPPVGNPYWSTSLLKSYVNRGEDLATIPAYPSLLALDPPTTISCAQPNVIHGSCGLVVDESGQMGLSGTASNQTTLVAYVDGLPLSILPFLGYLPTTNYQGFTWQDIAVGLPLGTHTVQTFTTSSNGGGDVGRLQVQYKVYGNP